MRRGSVLLLTLIGCETRSSPPHGTEGFRPGTPPVEPDTVIPDITPFEPDPSFVCGPYPREPAGVVEQVAQGDLWATIHPAPGSYTYECGMVGDVNGDGCDDLAMGSPEGTRIFFGPLGRGNWGAAEANLVLPDVVGRMRRGMDIDGDLRSEFWVNGVLWSFAGVEARSVFNAGAEDAELLDADGDGEVDAFMARDSSMVLAYGPLDTWREPLLRNGCSRGQAIPESSACFVLPRSDSEGYHTGDILADLNGDGRPELIVMSTDEYGGYESTAVFAGGDLRGRLVGRHPLVELTDVVTAWVPVLGDLDFDGYDEVAATGGVLSGSALLDPAALRTVAPPGTYGVVARGDIDGDDVIDLHLDVDGVPVLVSGTAVGVLPTDPTDPLYTSTVVTDGTGGPVYFSVDPFRVSSPGDITGDGRADLLTCGPGGVGVLASDDLFPQ